MLYIDFKVPLQGLLDNQQINKKGDSRYCYTRLAIKGKKTRSMICLGKIEQIDDVEYLIPNDNYFKFIAKKPSPNNSITLGPGRKTSSTIKLIERNQDLGQKSIVVDGYCMATFALAKEIHLFESLVATFGADVARDILGVSSFIALGGAEENSERFSKYNTLLSNQVITDQLLRGLYWLIYDDACDSFLRNWMSCAITDSLCYDVVSLPSLFNIGMLCSVNTGLPVFFDEYEGSIDDFSNLPYFLEKAKKLGITVQKTIVLEGGDDVAQDIQVLVGRDFNFIVGVPLSSIEEVWQKMVEWRKYKPDFDHPQVFLLTSNNGENESIYYHETSVVLADVSYRLFLYYSPALQVKEDVIFLSGLEAAKSRFFVAKDVDGNSSFVLNDELVIDEIAVKGIYRE